MSVAMPVLLVDGGSGCRCAPGTAAREILFASVTAIQVAAEQQLFFFCHELVPLTGVRVDLRTKKVVPAPTSARLDHHLKQHNSNST